uniref:Uncharacterized protein n=1 Tax=Megaselia scalaris TaxID=36166 RepID=T1GVU2_MEGSC
MLKEITDLAGQRERVAETFEEKIIHGILILAKTLKDERKVTTQKTNMQINYRKLTIYNTSI